MAYAKRFDNKPLVKKYGSWARVFAAFYEFIFVYQQIDKLNLTEIKHVIESGEWHEGGIFYNKTLECIEIYLHSFEEAWDIFLKHEKMLENGTAETVTVYTYGTTKQIRRKRP